MWEVPCYVDREKYAEKDNYDRHDSNDGFRPEFHIILKGSLHPVPVEDEMNDSKKNEGKGKYPVQVPPVVSIDTQNEVFF